MKKLYDALDSAMQALTVLPQTGNMAVDLGTPMTPVFNAIKELSTAPELAVDHARDACSDLLDRAKDAETLGYTERAEELRRINRALSPVVAVYISRYLLAPAPTLTPTTEA